MAAPIIWCVRAVSGLEFMKRKITTELAEGSRGSGELGEALSQQRKAEEGIRGRAQRAQSGKHHVMATSS